MARVIGELGRYLPGMASSLQKAQSKQAAAKILGTYLNGGWSDFLPGHIPLTGKTPVPPELTSRGLRLVGRIFGGRTPDDAVASLIDRVRSRGGTGDFALDRDYAVPMGGKALGGDYQNPAVLMATGRGKAPTETKPATLTYKALRGATPDEMELVGGMTPEERGVNVSRWIINALTRMEEESGQPYPLEQVPDLSSMLRYGNALQRRCSPHIPERPPQFDPFIDGNDNDYRIDRKKARIYGMSGAYADPEAGDTYYANPYLVRNLGEMSDMSAGDY